MPNTSPRSFLATVNPSMPAPRKTAVTASISARLAALLNPTSTIGRAFGCASSTTALINTSFCLLRLAVSIACRMIGSIDGETSPFRLTLNSASNVGSTTLPYSPSDSVTRAASSPSCARTLLRNAVSSARCTAGSKPAASWNVVSPTW